MECRVCRLLFPSVVKFFCYIKPIFSLTNKYPSQNKSRFLFYRSIYGSRYISKRSSCLSNSKFKVQKEMKFLSSAKRKAGVHFTQAEREAQLLSVALKTSKTLGKRSPEFVSLEKFFIASRFIFHSYPVTSIMNLNLALWYVLGGYASQEAGRDQRIRWTCIKILLAFKGWRSNPHLLKYFNDSSIWAEYYLPVPIIRRWSNCNFLFDMDIIVCCGNAVRRMSDEKICRICTNTIAAVSRSL